MNTEPRQGMNVFVLADADWRPGSTPLNCWVFGTNHRVCKVNSRSFYVYVGSCLGKPGRFERYLLVEWEAWLRGLLTTGRVWVDQQPLHMPAALPGHGGTAMPRNEVTIDVQARDARYLRAAGDVLKHYRIDRTGEEDGVLLFELTGGTRPYTVRVHGDWSEPPSCTCPDAVHRAEVTGGYCKHVIAVLLKHEDLRYQLLDVML